VVAEIVPFDDEIGALGIGHVRPGAAGHAMPLAHRLGASVDAGHQPSRLVAGFAGR
jgi:hypothetical protein